MTRIGLVLTLCCFAMFSCSDQDVKSEKKTGKTSAEATEKESVKTEEIELNNAIYLLKNEFKDSADFDGDGYLIPYAHDFLDSTSEEEIYFLSIDPNEFVELDLSEKPEGVVQEDERINLLLSLSGVAQDQMADFTEKHVGKHIAIVIGGKAYTKHKIKQKITAGKLQITRCTDNACEHLLVELKKNYTE